ncbi:MAG TPA: rhodanese-like domain-containing protein [Ferruginibacter sp.]|nr:rhodanese-like domain-containing protein [Ferruginibacter sp.]HMP22429.1 rhodanese-like domain-containing protein [Ferruginibacter sp.]
MQAVTVQQLHQLLQQQADIQLIDVREPDEHHAFNIGGTLIPLGEIMVQAGRIEKDKPVMVYCRKGIRSQLAIQRLQDKYPFANLYNVTGGTDAWIKAFGTT